MAENTDDRMREVWMPVPGYEGLYEVSNFGRILSHKGPKQAILKGGRGTCKMGYRRVTLRDRNSVATARYIHTLVLEAFEGPRPEGMHGLHKDGIVENCAHSNLYWGTSQQNADDMVRHGHSLKGRRNPNSHLTPRQIQSIRREYLRGTSRQVQLAAKFGVSQGHISRIILNKSWR